MTKTLSIIATAGSFFIALFLAVPDPAGSAEPARQNLPGARDDDAVRKAYFTDLKLITQEGKEVRFYSDLLKGKTVLIQFFYTDCRTIGPLQSKTLSELQGLLGDRLGRDIFLISITVDPAKDTPAKVKEYARTFAAKPGWIYLTGKKENVDWVNYKLGSYVENPEEHKGVMLLGNLKTGHWIKGVPETRAATLKEHLLKLADEGKGGR